MAGCHVRNSLTEEQIQIRSEGVKALHDAMTILEQLDDRDLVEVSLAVEERAQQASNVTPVTDDERPSESTVDPCLHMTGGHKFYLQGNVSKNEFPSLEKVSRILAQINRFGGHTGIDVVRPLSVAEHCLKAAELITQFRNYKSRESIPIELASYSSASAFYAECHLSALLHELDEIVTGDIPQPIKEWLKVHHYCHALEKLAALVKVAAYDAYNIPWPDSPVHGLVRQADLALLLFEGRTIAGADVKEWDVNSLLDDNGKTMMEILPTIRYPASAPAPDRIAQQWYQAVISDIELNLHNPRSPVSE